MCGAGSATLNDDGVQREGHAIRVLTAEIIWRALKGVELYGTIFARTSPWGSALSALMW